MRAINTRLLQTLSSLLRTYAEMWWLVMKRFGATTCRMPDYFACLAVRHHLMKVRMPDLVWIHVSTYVHPTKSYQKPLVGAYEFVILITTPSLRFCGITAF